LRSIGKGVVIGFISLFFSGFTYLTYPEEILNPPGNGENLPEPPPQSVKWKEGDRETKKADSGSPLIIEADHLEYHKETDTYEAWGSVKMTQERMHLESDYATLDNRTGDALAIGNVWYDDGDSILITERIELNLNTKLGVVYRGRIFQRTDNYYIEGEEMKKVGDDIYEIRRGSFTTCDPPLPSWRFRGKDVRIYLDDNISGRGIVFYIKDIPLLYTPYIKVPIKKERHSGFLLPRIGYNNQKGLIFDNAYFWAMADNMDSTFSLDYKGKIGLGAGIEYRYILSKDARGELFNYYLRDRELKKDFWELRFNHDHRITEGLQGKANIIYLSEPIFYKRFSTLTEERIQRGLESNLLLSKSWQTGRLYLLGQYRQDLTQSNAGTLQKLPELGYLLTNYRIGELPLYLSFESTAINFWRKTGIKGQRLNIYPQVSSTMNLGRGFILSPRMGFRERLYWTEGDSINKQIYDAGATLGTKIFKVFDVDGLWGMDKIKHSIEPSISYLFIPEVDQNGLPQFDNLDFIQKTNMATYSLTNHLLGRIGEGEKKRVFEFLTLRLSQGYDINKDKEPFTDVLVEGNLRTTDFLSFNASSTYNPYKRDITSFNSSLLLRGNSPWHISLEERYIKSPESLFIISEAGARVSRSLDFYGRIWYDATQKIVRETDLTGRYSSQCWSLNIVYIGRPEETQFLVTIDLKGIGTLKLPAFSERGM